jgi:hypothetical protein
MSNDLPVVEGMSLDNPHVDKKINAGTTAANCQPRHTRDALDADSDSDDDGSNIDGGSSTSSTRRLSRSERKLLKKEKKAAAARSKKEQEDPKKMGYVAMAKMGYQELVNAIIRPPRAEYKVRSLIEIIPPVLTKHTLLFFVAFYSHKIIDSFISLYVQFVGGNAWTASISILWKALYTNRFRIKNKARAQSSVLTLGTC